MRALAAAFGGLFGVLVLTVQAQPQQQPAPAPASPDTAAGRGVPQGRGAALPPLAPAAIERAEGILAETRKAMGGEKATGVRTIVASGRTRRVRGENLVPIEFEINIELPDKYVRKDEVPAEESQPTSTGFVGNEIIQFPVAPAGRGRGDAPPSAPPGRGRRDAPGGPPAAPAGGRGPASPPTPEQLEAQRTARLTTAKQEFARLMLGLLPASLETYPLTFGYAAQAAAPQGTADVLDVRGAGNFAARLFLGSDTKLPIMISWQAPPTAVLVRTPWGAAPPSVPPGAVIVDAPAPPAPGAAPEASAEYTKQVAALRQKAQAAPVEYRIYYADYRDVDGVKFPFRLRRAIGADTTEETSFDRFRLNTKIDPRKFTVPK
jgi:hypothetical protein